MPITSLPTYATGDTIEALTPNTLRDNISLLDGRTGGDPGALGKMLMSNGATGGGWLAPGTEAYVLCIVGGVPTWAQITAAGITDTTITAAKLAASAAAGNLTAGQITAAMLHAGAALANLTYTPVNQAGDTMTAKLSVSQATGTGNNLDGLDLNQLSGGNSGVYMRFLTPSGGMTFGFFYGNAIFDLIDHNGTEALSIHWSDQLLYRYSNKVWDAAIDGSGSGLDADLLDGHDTSATSTASHIPLADGSGHIDKGWLTGITDTEIAAANKDGATGTASMRTLGTGSAQAAAGNHGHTNLANGLTINSNTAWHAGNDGSGSGLDADLLDGVNSTGFAQLASGGDFTTAPTINSKAIDRISTGSYTGTGTGLSTGSVTVSSIGFTAGLIVISDTTSGTLMGFVQGGQVCSVDGAGSVGAGSLALNGSGFVMTGTTAGLNVNGHHYTFTAFG